MKGLTRRAALLLPLAAAGCSALDDWFGTTQEILPGKREPIMAVRQGLAPDPSDTRAIVLPAAAPVPEWPQPGGGPTHVVGNVAVKGFNQAWRSSIGEGGGYRQKVTAQPIVIPGLVVTMDSDGLVDAFLLANGKRAWRTDTQSDEDRSTNIGGGVSFANGVVYATTGRAEVLALDAGTGKIKWRKPLGSPARSAATIADGRLLVLTLDDQLQSFAMADGARQWSYQASATPTTLLGQAAPAFDDGIVVAGFGSGDLVALRSDSGALVWSDTLASARGGQAGLTDLSGIRALPVIDAGRVFAIGSGGLLVALDLRSGRRLWEREAGGLQTPWLAGDWMFVQTGNQALAAVGRDDGRVRWATDLPRYENPEKKRGPLYWTGPVLAGGKLILAGSNSQAVSMNPETGKLMGWIELPDAASVAPVAAAGTLFLVTDDGYIQAYR